MRGGKWDADQGWPWAGGYQSHPILRISMEKAEQETEDIWEYIKINLGKGTSNLAMDLVYSSLQEHPTVWGCEFRNGQEFCPLTQTYILILVPSYIYKISDKYLLCA